ncbi:MAG: PEP/pyruvate-binding domain-containing protein, partial [Holophagae bacterium]
GSTAAGLDRLRHDLLDRFGLGDGEELVVEVPASVVVAADVFSAFMDRNQLTPEGFVGLTDRQIARIFAGGELPHGLMARLSEVTDAVTGPLAVRPSSVLEQEIERSIGGVYVAKMIPNHSPVAERRARQLADAVRLVWASTFFTDAVNWRRGAGTAADAEQMAVVIQPAVGERHGSRFYPTVSAVARSYNHYPTPGDRPEDGVVNLALGFGKIMSEAHTWTYSPGRPTAPPPFKSVGDLLKYSQTTFWALDLGDPVMPHPTREEEYLVRLGLADAEQDGTLALLASTYDPESDRLRAGIEGAGPRALTFAPLLGSTAVPFRSTVDRVLEVAAAEISEEVEIEIAATFDPVSGTPMRIALVQLKTIPGRIDESALEVDDLTGDDVFVASETCLGNGVRDDLVDVVYLKPTAFDRHQTRTIAAELDAVNRGLLEEERAAIFIGFGRWGTTDDRYGVPVRWGQISSADVIVEVTIPEAPLNLSQGTHFFHHVLSQRVLYLSVEHDGAFDVELDWLDDLEAVWEGRYVRHVRLDTPVEVNVDGANRLGLIRRPAP